MLSQHVLAESSSHPSKEELVFVLKLPVRTKLLLNILFFIITERKSLITKCLNAKSMSTSLHDLQ